MKKNKKPHRTCPPGVQTTSFFCRKLLFLCWAEHFLIQSGAKYHQCAYSMEVILLKSNTSKLQIVFCHAAFLFLAKCKISARLKLIKGFLFSFTKLSVLSCGGKGVFPAEGAHAQTWELCCSVKIVRDQNFSDNNGNSNFNRLYRD